MEAQEVCPGGSHHLIYLGILAYTVLKIVFSAFLFFLMTTGWFKPVPTGEICTHTLPQAILTLQISCTVRTKIHFKTQTWSGHPAAQNPSQALLGLNGTPLSTSHIEALRPSVM